MKVFTKNSNNGSSSNSFIQRKGNDTFFGTQAKLKVGKPNDKYEVEADSVANKVVAKSSQQNNSPFSSTPFISPSPSTQVQKKENPPEKSIAQTITPVIQLAPAEEETVQEKCDNCEAKEEKVQKMPFEEAQAKEEQEESMQMMEEEEAQTKEEDEESMQMMEEEEVQSKEEEEESVQMMEEEEAQSKEEEKEEEEAQTKLAVPKKPSKDIGGRIQSARGGGSPLPSQTKLQMESGFGADFSDVKIHTNSEATSMSKDIGAKAFTSKNDIFFNEGNFSPQSKEGQTLLAHELTHTIQQGASNPKTEEETSQETNNLAPTSEGNNDTATASSETATEEVAVEGGEIPIEKNAEVKEEKGKDKKSKGKESTGASVTTTPRNPKEDPNFKKLEGRIETTASGQQEHEDSTASAGAAQSAAISPENERGSMAQTEQVDVMDNAEAKEFDAKAFKEKLMERIKGMQLPTTPEQADNFDDNNNITEVNQAATQDVSNEQTAAAGPIEQTSQQEPNVDAVPEREVTTLPEAPIGTPPPSVNPNNAMPPTRGKAEINTPLQENMSEVDQEMSENKVTDKQLEKSNEPTFNQGLEAKNQAEEDTLNAPKKLCQKEQGILQNTKTSATSKGQEGLEGMHQGRSKLLNQVALDQTKTGTTDTSERTRIASAINKIYEKAKIDVEKILTDLDQNVKSIFTKGTVLAKQKFEQHVESKMRAYKSRRYSGATGFLKWGYDKLAGMPDEVNDFFVTGRKVYIDYMDKVITVVSKLVASQLTEAKARVTKGKNEVQTYVSDLPKNLQKIGKEAAEKINDKFDELEDSVDSKQDELIDSLAEQYMEGLNAVDARIEEMKAANRGLIDAALGFINGIIETIKKLKELINNLLAAIANMIDVIMEDPIAFVSTLFSGIGKGIDMFMANIQKHVLGGFITWLTGAMGPIGITLPENVFSLKGIFSLIMQVLGLSWDYMRMKSVKLLGEPIVKAMETSFEMFKIIKEKGVMGMWDYLKESFTDLKETIIDSIKQMLITQVLEAGIKWLLSLLIPGAGFIKAIMAIKDLIVFFVESAMMLIPSLIQAITALANGNVSGVSKAIEKGLAMLVPLVIGLFAKLLGLGGLVKKVQKIIKKIRKRIDRAINKLIKKARSAFKKLLKKGKAKVKGAVAAVLQWWKVKKKVTFKNGEKHTLFFKGTGKQAKLYMRSEEMTVEQRINQLPAGKNKTNLLAEYQRDVVAKINANADKELPEAKQKKFQKDIAASLLSIGNKLDGGGDQPPSAVTHSVNGGRASVVTVAPLTNIPGNTAGSAANANPLGWNMANWENSNTKHPTRTTSSGAPSRIIKWRRIHLLSHKLHGPGTETWNLTPTNQSTNSMLESQETSVYNEIKDGATFYKMYKVKAEYNHPNSEHNHSQAGTWNKNQFPTKVTLTKQKDGESAKTIVMGTNLPTPDPGNMAPPVDYFELIKPNIDAYFADTDSEDRKTASKFINENLNLGRTIPDTDQRTAIRNRLRTYYDQNK